VAVICLGQLLPVGSAFQQATYPPVLPGPGTGKLGLAGGGVCPAGAVTGAAVRSYRTISPLPDSPCFLAKARRGTIGCVFSVALSLGLPPVAVSHHRALSCPDFPPPLIHFVNQNDGGDRPTHSF